MSEYTIFPSVNETLQFPPSLRAAIAKYPELTNFFAPKASAALTSPTLTTPTLTTPTLSNAKFTGTTTGITKAMVGLTNVDNTTDLLKPISTATQTALNAKAPLSNPTFTGTVKGVTAAMVGLGSVNNTADTAKPVSTAQAASIDLRAMGQVARVASTAKLTLTNETQVLRIGFRMTSGRNYRARVRLNTLSSIANTAFAVMAKLGPNDATITGTQIEAPQTHYTSNGVNLGRTVIIDFTWKAESSVWAYIKINVQQATQLSATFSVNERGLDVYDMGANV